MEVLCEVADGLVAVQKAQELKPDLMFLDLGLPSLNGVEAARQIRQVSPNSKIIFLSQDNSLEVVQEALSTGGLAYVYKARAGSELIPAVEAVHRGERFVSRSIKGYKLSDTLEADIPHHHEVLFHSDDTVFLEGFTRCIAAALKSGNAAIVNVSKPHLDALIEKLKAAHVDVEGAALQGTFISLNVTDTLSTFMVNDLPDPVRFLGTLGGLIEAAAKATKAEHPRVTFCGEGIGLLWMEGKPDAAIRAEQLCNELAKAHAVDFLCSYPLNSFHGDQADHSFQCICAEHSGLSSR